MKKIVTLLFLFSLYFNSYSQASVPPCSTGTTDAASSGYDIGISNFQTSLGVSNISNSSAFVGGAPNDYTDQYVEVYSGADTDINFSITIGSTYYNKIQIHLDSDGDGQFSQSEQVFELSQTFGTQTGTITIPSVLAEADYNLRVLTTYSSSYIDPCAPPTGFPNSLGEIEDYTLRVSAEPSCTPPMSLSLSSISCDKASPAEFASSKL